MSLSVVVGLLLVLVQSSAALSLPGGQVFRHHLSLSSSLSSVSFLLPSSASAAIPPSSLFAAVDDYDYDASHQLSRQQQLEVSSSSPAQSAAKTATTLRIPPLPSRVVVNNVSHKCKSSVVGLVCMFVFALISIFLHAFHVH